MEADPPLHELAERVETLYEGDLAGDPAHDLAHSWRVAVWTCRLGGDEVDWRLAVAAALLHDIDNPPKDAPEAATAADRSAALARRWLPEIGFEAESVEEVAGAIRDHSYRRGARPATPLGRALQDADRLEALGVLGWMRAVACGTRLGSSFVDPEDPWAGRRALDDRRYMVDHYFVKLARLAPTLSTAAGRREAARRHDTLAMLLRSLGEELEFDPFPG